MLFRSVNIERNGNKNKISCNVFSKLRNVEDKIQKIKTKGTISSKKQVKNSKNTTNETTINSLCFFSLNIKCLNFSFAESFDILYPFAYKILISL